MGDIFVQQVMVVVYLANIRDTTHREAECGVREIEGSINIRTEKVSI